MKTCGQLAILFVSVVLVAQVPAAKKPSFDVISVKVDKDGGPPRRTGIEGNRFIAENVPLIPLILYAYRGTAPALLADQVIGGPAWISRDRFDVEAKLEGNVGSIPTQQTWLMVQSLLEDRFKLRTHWETREMPVYHLVVAKSGLKMRLSGDQSLPRYDDDADGPSDSSADLRGEMNTRTTVSGQTVISGMAIPMSPNLASRRPHALLPHSIIEILWGNTRRPVIDKTGLKGLYDFRLQFNLNPLPATADTSVDSSAGPSLFSAIEEQLGLKLQSARGPIAVLVIDRVQPPMPN